MLDYRSAKKQSVGIIADCREATQMEACAALNQLGHAVRSDFDIEAVTG